MGCLQISFTYFPKLCSSIFKLNVDLMSCIIFFTYFSSRTFLSSRQSEDNLGASDWECTTCCIDTHRINTLKMYNIFSYLHITSNDLDTISFEAYNLLMLEMRKILQNTSFIGSFRLIFLLHSPA